MTSDSQSNQPLVQYNLVTLFHRGGFKLTFAATKLTFISMFSSSKDLWFPRHFLVFEEYFSIVIVRLFPLALLDLLVQLHLLPPDIQKGIL